MGLFRKRRGRGRNAGQRAVWAIRRSVLDMVMEASRDSYPKEFAGILRAEGGVITEIMLLPGTISGGTSAILRLHMLPIDYSVVGTVHSHPGRSSSASGADLGLFRRFGDTHIIASYPYGKYSWQCYDRAGNNKRIEVVDG